MSKSNPSECVGSLLVHSSDVQELSEVHHGNLDARVVHQIADTIKDELKHDECIGSLLIHTDDMQELLSATKGDNSRIQRRITEQLNKMPEIKKEEVIRYFP